MFWLKLLGIRIPSAFHLVNPKLEFPDWMWQEMEVPCQKNLISDLSQPFDILLRFSGIRYIPWVTFTWIHENRNSSSAIRWSITGINTAHLKYSSVVTLGTFVRFVCLWHCRGVLSSISAIWANSFTFGQISLIKTSSQFPRNEFNCVFTSSDLLMRPQSHPLLYLVASELNCFVKPRVYEHTFNATRNVDSVMFYSRPLAKSTVLWSHPFSEVIVSNVCNDW